MATICLFWNTASVFAAGIDVTVALRLMQRRSATAQPAYGICGRQLHQPFLVAAMQRLRTWPIQQLGLDASTQLVARPPEGC